MNDQEIARLKFRNQYVLAPHGIDCPFLHKSHQLVGSSVLYTHIDLKVSQYSEGDLRLILLGDIFDYESDNKSDVDILRDLAEDDLERFLQKTDRYCGRYVIFYIRSGKLYASHDATATRKVFYCQTEGGAWCASQPYMLAKIIGLEKSTDPSRINYYQSESFLRLNCSNIGDTTYWDEIHQVLANHYLDVNELKSIRFWPWEMIKSYTVDECATISARILKGYLENIASRYKLMLPVTAGKDSRTLLAAASSFRDKVYYYINGEKRMEDSNKDILIPSKILKEQGLDFHILDPYIQVDEDFKRIYYENNEFASDFYLPIIYNYYLNFGDRVNLPGNVATGASWFYPLYKKNISVDTLLGITKVKEFGHARETYSRWLKNCKEACESTRTNRMDLFYWEERIGNWGTQIQLDKDIAQNDINPYNSRLLMHTMLSVEPNYAIEYASYSLNRKIIELLWPELMKYPINPSRTNKVLTLLESMGLLGALYRMQYR